MKKTIIFRADGNSSTGLGHLYRLFSLVEIVRTNYDFVFVTKTSSIQQVIPSHYKKKTIVETISIDKEPFWFTKNFSPEHHIIIADGYQFDSSYQKKIKKEGFKLIYVDDLATEHMFADVVINHSPFLNEKHYSKESYTRLALGTQYALLRPSFIKEAKLLPRKINNIDSVFVCFGGSDPYNLTFKAVSALLEIDNFKKISIILGAAYKFQDIFELKQQNASRIEIHQSLSENDLLDTMKKCNLAIVPASTILFEICCVKIPTISGFYVDNQEFIYKGFLDKRAIFEAGNMAKFESANFKSIVKEIISKNSFEIYLNKQKQLFDDKITERHLNLISELC
ncbi:MAG: UDP-2,4-diacetamido-2,4,6-trideoxy-beta-L-altropyranose hydrolase [Bacteroidota bacterium]